MNRIRLHGGERGAILILAMLVLLVLAAVLLQIWFTADVDLEIALNEQVNFPIQQAAYGAFMKACSVLVQDLQEGSDAGEEGSGGDAGGLGGDEGGGGGGDGLGGGGDDLGGGGGGGEDFMGGGGGSTMTDSMVDSWARCGEISMAFASDVDVQVLIRDEDGKINILSILSEDEEFAEDAKERLTRVIDLFREGTKADVSHGASRDMVNAMEDWMRGNRDREKFPRPLVKTGPEDQNADELEKEPIDFPLTLEELVMCEGISKELLFGYRENEMRIPGLTEYVTIYSNLVFDSVQADEEETDIEEDPFDGESDEGEYDQTPDEEGDEGGEDDPAEVAVETSNGLININTAPLPVLKSLMDNKDLSHSILDQVDEFRLKALEAYEKAMEDYDWSENLYDEDNSSGSGDEGSDEGDGGKDFFEEDEEEDFIFTSGKEVFERVEDYFDTTFNIDEDIKTDFGGLVDVKSNVFTIYITVKSMETRTSKSFRAVVWRRTGDSSSAAGSQDPSQEGGGDYSTTGAETAQIITLVPLEPFHHPIPYRPEEEELLAEREEAYQYERDYY